MVSIVISFVFFYLCHMSLNIISLAGLILALGMMIDSSIIVTENISQYRERGYSLRRACITGTSEVVTPMLSSSLTTIAVFAPLIFMSGIAGAIFYDQAFSVTVGLMVSYFTGIMLLPVLYLLVYRTGVRTRKWKWLSFKFNNPIKDHTLDRFYDAGIDWVFSHKTFSVLFCIVSIPLCVFFFFFIDKQRMPDIEENELIVRIEWNENIHVDENRKRVDELFKELDGQSLEQTASIGRQDFILNRERELSSSEAELYFRTETSDGIAHCRQVSYRVHGKPYFAIGFQNVSGGWELRSKLFKGCIPPKDISLVSRQGMPTDTCDVFEGFFDFLSAATLGLTGGNDALVLNSVGNLERSFCYLDGYGKINCYLDNDEAGRKTFEALHTRYAEKTVDCSRGYADSKDLNEHLQKKLSERVTNNKTLKFKL